MLSLHLHLSSSRTLTLKFIASTTISAGGTFGLKTKCANGTNTHNLMRMTNAEQHELLRDIRMFFTGPAGCGKTFILRLAMDLYNRYSNTGNNTVNDAFLIIASTGMAAVAGGGTTVHVAFKLSR
ncbi:hypothetical protein HPB48_011674 [Haemaphysalis longicornis]|uniref:ATP-dependent DNA helicase n=1 Tax=Haemaphysalis longicornis TaxID=44386 RepID=A0A9J6GYG9_HAELO|nr:hypothetical protein HPB48_011674 [Haemaphysalis longicornis]